MCARALNLWVFRESRRAFNGFQYKSALLDELHRWLATGSSHHLITALLRAGELECGVADEGSVPVEPCSKVTDRVADALIAAEVCVDSQCVLQILEEAHVPNRIEVSSPEGFAYYALDPLAYVGVLKNVPHLGDSVAVVGIRSIGTTLSGVAAAAARAGGRSAERITVRPAGHPYNRCTTFSAQQLDFVQRHANRGSSFLVVDEGPGLSGSSFLSVAEALENSGIPRGHISLVCGHPPKFDELRADHGPRRARRFRWIAVANQNRLPHGAVDFIGGGQWRNRVFDHAKEWPASWLNFERLKYLSASESEPKRLFKFIGFGHYGDSVFARENEVAQAGFAPAPLRESDGFASYPWITSRPMTSRDLSQEMIERLAAYCAFRLCTFSSRTSDIDTLQHMAEHNLAQLDLSIPVRLSLKQAVIVDGSMHPHKWLLTPDGQTLKTDSGSHGDDHFFPGPTDIAWDLAGAIIEWRMTSVQRGYFLDCYRNASSDDASERIGDFLVAYAAFRCAYCRMAANALAGSEEQSRLEFAAQGYEMLLFRLAQESLVYK